MKLSPERLAQHLRQPLLPVYLVSGDDVLLVMEAADAVRTAARAQGYETREVLDVERGFDWTVLAQAAQTLSLFGERRVLELRLASGRPGDAGARALTEYAAAPAPDTVLLIVSGKLDSSAQRTKWYRAIDAVGVLIPVWPLDAARLPGWIAGRMRALDMQPDADAVALLAERIEGNLVAAVQEIEKLRLLLGAGAVSAEDIHDAVVRSARYDVYSLVDSALGGNVVRTWRILEGLREEGVEPTLVVWAVARELRSLAAMAADCGGAPGRIEQVIAAQRVWQKRKPLVKRALQSHSLHDWQSYLRAAARCDRVIKGVAAGNIWDELLELCMAIAGVALPGAIGPQGSRRSA